MVRSVNARERWLREGLVVLAELGAPSLRIDRLAERLGMTKGSFYHHFDGLSGYRRELLSHFEEQSTLRYIANVEAVDGLDPRAKLERLMNLVLVDAKRDEQLEVALRAWALQDDEVREAQRRTDAIRIDYLGDLCTQAGCTKRQAIDMARMLYLVLIGAGHIVPPLEPAELRRLWVLTLRLLPE